MPEILGLVEIRRCKTKTEARQLGLVLTARGIASQILPLGNGLALCVPERDASAAEHEIAAYESENAAPATPPSTRANRHGGLETALAYIALLVFVFAATQRGAFGWDWMAQGAADAGAIRAGAWWRTVTALTLHVDGEHLLSNIVFGGVAGALVVQMLGAGVGWLAILLSGVVGNAINALLLQASGHVAVGASTAVFGALGLLAGHTQRRTATTYPWRQGLRRWSPAAAGVLLLGFLGFGEGRVDIGAHIAGFGAGFGFGLGLTSLDPTRLKGGWHILAGGACAATVLSAWWVATK